MTLMVFITRLTRFLRNAFINHVTTFVIGRGNRHQQQLLRYVKFRLAIFRIYFYFTHQTPHTLTGPTAFIHQNDINHEMHSFTLT